MIIYLAGPISGKSYDEVVSLYKDKSNFLNEVGYEVLCPMTGKTYLRTELKFRESGYDGFPVSTNHAIFERDKWMVSNCDIILADLSNSGDRISIGTMMELAWASLLGKHTLIILPKDNVHKHAFVLESGDIVFETLEEANKYLIDLIKGI
jgi:nucleoside 2-deoxyribosyltransferase